MRLSASEFMSDTIHSAAPRKTTALLDALVAEVIAAKGDGATITLGELIDQLKERAIGLVLLILALPCCLPFVYGVPQAVALPMLFFAGQMAIGRRTLWLPENLRARSFQVATLKDIIDRGRRYIGWFEAVAHPRLAALTSPTGTTIVGALLLIPTASILVPLPLTNTVPGAGVAIASVGLIERDGLLVLFGLLVGLVWVAILVIGGPAAIYWLVNQVR